jgi:hypothetical protein
MRSVFLIQLLRIMLILLPVFLMLLTALTLLILRFTRPQFKYTWMLAAGGATLALISVFLWQIRFPQSISLPPWRPVTVFFYVPGWLADGTSWPYALSLAALAAAVIWTSVVRAENEPMPWAGTLTLCALGILATTSANPLTLVLAWSIIDLTELVIMLRSTEGENQSLGVVIAFSVRLTGTGLLLWANSASIAAGTPLDFRSIPPSAGIYLLIAAGLRLGVLPLHLPYRKENVVRRGFGTSLRLVSASASLILLARIPASASESPLTPYLLILAAITVLYAGWMWLRSSDEILGRPFWVLGLGSLAVADSLRGNPTGSTGWGVALILCGGLLFIFSARQRQINWIPILGLWGISTLPFSLTSAAWQAGNNLSWLFFIPFIPAQALMMTGFFRHILHPGETSLESQEKWVKIIYPAGLLLLAGIAILLGLWGWDGAQKLGVWWLSVLAILLAAGFSLLAQKFLTRLHPGNISARWTQISPIGWLYNVIFTIYNFLRRIADIFTSSLEGEGGLLWSFLLLVLIISIISTRGQ